MKGCDSSDSSWSWPALCLALLVATYIFAAIIPASQAPDESDHVRRAYLLGHGRLILQNADRSPSGGQIDGGLELYLGRMDALGLTPSQRHNVDEQAALDDLQWSGHPQAVLPTGTAYYFPALYLPHAVGLRAGELLGWSVGSSYRLARYLSLLSSLALIALGFRMYSPPPVAIAILAMPMSMFLMSCAVLDGMANAMVIVALSAFMRVLAQKLSTPKWVSALLLASVMLVVSCRTNTLPFLLLPFAAGYITRQHRMFAYAAGGAALVLAWTAFTIKFTVYPSGPAQVNHAARLAGHLLHPGDFIHLLWATLTNGPVIRFYSWSFIGVLGWLNAAFAPAVYNVMGSLLAVIAAMCISRHSWRNEPRHRSLLLVCALGTVILTFLALQIQWKQADPSLITGVQGRYFIIPALAVAYAAFATPVPLSAWRIRASTVLLLVFMAIGFYQTSRLLLARFYVEPAAYLQAAPFPDAHIVASTQLSATETLRIRFDQQQEVTPRNITLLSLDFATYQRTNKGTAFLRLWTRDGDITQREIDLSSLEDNRYHLVVLDGKPYVGGEIVSRDGFGVSLWEVRRENGQSLTCMKYSVGEGPAVVTAGCPQP